MSQAIIKKLADHAGGTTALAGALRISPSFCCQLASGKRPIPDAVVERALLRFPQIVTLADFRPGLAAALAASTSDHVPPNQQEAA